MKLVFPGAGNILTKKIKRKQGNRGNMRKIHVTRQLFEASGGHGDLIEKLRF